MSSADHDDVELFSELHRSSLFYRFLSAEKFSVVFPCETLFSLWSAFKKPHHREHRVSQGTTQRIT
jgi:hypothetical protein